VAGWLTDAGLGVPETVSHKQWGVRVASDPAIACLVATRASSPVGLVRLDLGPDRTAEVSVVVAPEARRAGLGRQLVAAARAEAERRGVRRLVAAIQEDNTAAVGLFRGQGYRYRSADVPGFVHLESLVPAPREVAS